MTSTCQARSRDVTRFSPPFLPAKQVATGQKVNGKKKKSTFRSLRSTTWTKHRPVSAPGTIENRAHRFYFGRCIISVLFCRVSRFSLTPRPAAASRAVEALDRAGPDSSVSSSRPRGFSKYLIWARFSIAFLLPTLFAPPHGVVTPALRERRDYPPSYRISCSLNPSQLAHSASQQRIRASKDHP
ncbi:uncharacterized protein TRUGW13939_10484 [Talaromyces rugulosus]|uniref:Uncharacterized protein n=1 Tax=Talaromyces rugulosus TaxID=121627 RepID=A0A7H8RA57_TALRU|nr:uncharacterized protein TRUGW13939_10484 [Talaromyces rugulosus]QKX63314.1 hypothetical protein TRUGW13939_10484 [Talaromyces rugulosus]